MELDQWFANLWDDYVAIAPRVSSIRQLLEARGEVVANDHVAFRTLNIAPIDLESLGAIIEGLGYEPFDDYRFPVKKLRARSYVRAGYPRVFLSELLVDELDDPKDQVLLRELAASVSPDRVSGPDAFWSGRMWPAIRHERYLELRERSEYGAWFAVLGLRPNHFTVSVNSLTTFEGLDDLLDFVATSGFALNESGGRIKGSRDVLLEQGSTLADQVEVEFAEGAPVVTPTCYYEFALRHPTPSGALYDGFVAASADKIFESTDARR